MPTAQPARTHITFVTDWKAQAEHGGFYEALAEGLYAKRGLDVTITTNGVSDAESFAMLQAFGMPFSKDGRNPATATQA